MKRKSNSQNLSSSLLDSTPESSADNNALVLEIFDQIDLELNSIILEDFENVKLPLSYLMQKVKVVQALCGDLKSKFDSLSFEKHELQTQFQAKISSIESELVEAENLCSTQKEKIQLLCSQLEQNREDNNKLNEDLNSTLTMLNDQFVNKNAGDIEELEEKYKCLEGLYKEQIEFNSALQDQVVRLEEEIAEIQNREVQSRIKYKTGESEMNSKMGFFDRDIISSSVESKPETANSMIDRVQSEAIIMEIEQELEKVTRINREYEFKILSLNNKIIDLQEGIKDTRCGFTMNEDLIDKSEEMIANDYELTKSLQMLTNPYFENNHDYGDIVKHLSAKGLVDIKHQNEFFIIKSACEKLISIHSMLLKHSIISASDNLLESLQRFIEVKSSEGHMLYKSLENNRVVSEENERTYNLTEPSPRTSRSGVNNSVLQEKLISKKKEIALHKQQILCLKSQLREAESMIRLNQNSDFNLLRSLIRKIFEVVPKLDETCEKEIEVCIKCLGFSREEIIKLRDIRQKKSSRFKIFG